MDESWRHFLYYTLGLTPSLFFGLRFLIQWISSEKRKTSYVGRIFWYLSICGNTLLATHYFIQVQFLPFIIQMINGFISWRNINLSSTSKRTISLSRSVATLLVCLFTSTTCFWLQVRALAIPFKWIELPISLVGRGGSSISYFWHFVGGVGCVLFASRFWVQWIEAERTGKSFLGKHFWIISIWGSLCAMTYFLYIHDWVSSLNYSFGLIPYVRNLILMRRHATHERG